MNIKLEKLKIQNYKSIKDLDITLQEFSVIFGQNDSGKSNFLQSLKLAFGNGNIEKKDVFSSPQFPYSTETTVNIDLMFIPVNGQNLREDIFDETWAMHLGENVMTDRYGKAFFAYRTQFSYDIEKEGYKRDRFLINTWEEEILQIGSTLKIKTLDAFDFTLIEAQRDIASDIRDQASIWCKEISKIKLSIEARSEIETSLSILSNKIVEESPFLLQVTSDLADATNSQNSTIEISPITRRVEDIYKGLDIYVAQESSSSFSISNLGLGTRSRAVFSALKTIVNKRFEATQDSAYFSMLAFEEPEAHIHPQSQKQLVKDFNSMSGQKIITSHSPYLLSTAKFYNLIYCSLKNAQTICTPISSLQLDNDEIRQIERFVLNTRGEIFFANVVILAEGETEEQALQIFFREYFEKEPYELGISIIGVGGKNYYPFLKMLESMGIKWFIFSDGENSAINDLKTTMRKLNQNDNLSNYAEIITLDNYNDFEMYLFNNNYENEIINAINKFEDDGLAHPKLYFDKYIDDNHGNKLSPNVLRDYHSPGGRDRALLDCMKSGKAKYAAIISETICTTCNENRKFPPKIKELLDKIKCYLEGVSYEPVS